MRPIVVLCVVVVIAASCTSGKPDEGGVIEGRTVVLGEVSAAEDLAGATVTIRRPDRSDFPGSTETKTLRGGAFALEAEDLTRNFELVATGGTLGRRVFTGELTAAIRGYERGTSDVHINAGTTIVAAYLAKHPEASLSTAGSVVSRFLGVPDVPNLPLHFSVSERDFDQEAFLAEAAKHGGIADYADDLVEEIDSGRKRHAFPGKAENAPALDIAAFVFEGLRADANSAACLNDPASPQCPEDRVGFGGALRFFASPQERALADITAKLDRISAQLTALSSVVNEIKASVDQETYNNIVGFMKPEVVDRAMKTFKEVTQNCAASRASTYCKTELGDGTDEKPGALRRQIREALIDGGVLDGIPPRVSGTQGSSGTTGVLQVWPKVVKNDSGKFFKATDSKRLLDGLDYFYDLEMTAITLAVNYWRWEGRNETDIKADIDKFETAVKEQQKVFSPLPAGTLLFNPTGRMWSTSVFCSTYGGFGPRETNQCPATYAGFPVRDHRFQPSPGYPTFPSFQPGCSPGYWCAVDEDTFAKLFEGATQPWGAWLSSNAGISIKPNINAETGGRVWTNDVTCYDGGGNTGFRCCPPRCVTQRKYADLARSGFALSPIPSSNLGGYLFVRFPTEAARYI